MKKPGNNKSNQQRRGHTPQKSQARFAKQGGGGSRNRVSGSGRNSEATRMWSEPTSKTLTSHINMIAKNSRDGGGSRKNDNRNGGGNQPNRSRGKFKGSQDRNRSAGRNPDGGAGRNRSDSRPPRQAAASSVQEKSTDYRRENAKGRDLVANIEPFDLFCAYHLGITLEKGYRPANINEVANRFRVDPATIRQALKEYAMDSGSLLDRDFDMALAQLDIQVAPEGVDRLELAKGIYEDFLDAPHLKRDWQKLLEEDRKENQKVFKD